MLKVKKGLVWLTILVLAAIIGLQGCSKTEEPTATPAPVATAAPEPSASPEPELEPVTLSWYYPGTVQPDQQIVFDKVNSVLQEKLKVTVEFNAIDFGAYQDKMKIKMSAAEDFDLAFTAGWINNYEQNAASGAFVALDDLLPLYAPKLMASMPEFMWTGAKVNGKIYGTPNYQLVAIPQGMWFKKELVDKYQIDLTKIKPGMPATEFYSVLGEFFKVIKENEPDIYPIEIFDIGFWGNMYGSTGFERINNFSDGILNGDFTKIVNSYELPEFKEYLAVAKDWFDKGYIRKDIISYKQVINNPDEKAGKYFSGFKGYGPDTESQLKSAWGYDVVMAQYGKTFLTPGNFTATMTGISKTSKNPERALMLIELLNSDKELYNTLAFGLEGTHYTKISENRIEPVKDSKYNPAFEWMFGSTFNAYVTPGKPDDVWEKSKKLNNEAIMANLGAFKFDNASVLDKVKQQKAIIDEYCPGMCAGAVDWEPRLEAMLDKLGKAGLADVFAENLKQLTAWKSQQ